MAARIGRWQSDEGGAGWRRGSAVPEGGRHRCRLWAWGGRRWWREAGLGEELEAVCRNSAGCCGGLDLRESDAGQTQPETAAGRSHQLLSVPWMRALSWGAVMSAWGGAVWEEKVQEQRGRGVGAAAGGGRRSDLQWRGDVGWRIWGDAGGKRRSV